MTDKNRLDIGQELMFLDGLGAGLATMIGAGKRLDELITERMNQIGKLNGPANVVVRQPESGDTEIGTETAANQQPTPTVLPPGSNESKFKFGATSEKELVGVHPKLVLVARTALRLSTQDFMVFDGLRTDAEQRRHMANGMTRTMKSKHMVQPDGFGHALDLVPFIGGKPVWDWEGCYRIALAVDEAATQLGCADNIVWGGAWDRRLSDFGGNGVAYENEVQAYRKRHAGPDFIDGPHYEWRV